ncbi:MAG: hypothetical protein ACOC3V_04125 [bacterium]
MKLKQIETGLNTMTMLIIIIFVILLISLTHALGMMEGRSSVNTFYSAKKAYDKGIKKGYISGQIDLLNNLSEYKSLSDDEKYQKELKRILKEIEKIDIRVNLNNNPDKQLELKINKHRIK